MTLQDLREKKDFTFQDIVEILQILRGEEGCEWDRAQTHRSIRSNTIEEAYELADAIDKGDMDNLIEETGDLLLQSLFHIEIASKEGEFGYQEVYNRLGTKLISRHTHIFGTDKTASAAEALGIWEKNKLAEKPLKTHAENLKNVPQSMPALLRAYKIQEKAAKAGFDFKDIEGAILKIHEELEEFITAKDDFGGDIEEELGDLLFSVVNVCRLAGIEPETALNRANTKFIRRFEEVERRLSAEGRLFSDAVEANKHWEECKKNI